MRPQHVSPHFLPPLMQAWQKLARSPMCVRLSLVVTSVTAMFWSCFCSKMLLLLGTLNCANFPFPHSIRTQ